VRSCTPSRETTRSTDSREAASPIDASSSKHSRRPGVLAPQRVLYVAPASGDNRRAPRTRDPRTPKP
jgi:hypothetical protein